MSERERRRRGGFAEGWVDSLRIYDERMWMGDDGKARRRGVLRVMAYVSGGDFLK